MASRKALREFRYQGFVVKKGDKVDVAPQDLRYLLATGRIADAAPAEKKRGLK